MVLSFLCCHCSLYFINIFIFTHFTEHKNWQNQGGSNISERELSFEMNPIVNNLFHLLYGRLSYLSVAIIHTEWEKHKRQVHFCLYLSAGLPKSKKYVFNSRFEWKSVYISYRVDVEQKKEENSLNNAECYRIREAKPAEKWKLKPNVWKMQIENTMISTIIALCTLIGT